MKVFLMCRSALIALTVLASSLAAAEFEDVQFEHHAFGVVFGATRVNGESEGTAGFDYEYKFNRYVGLGGVYEYTERAYNRDGMSSYLASAYVHPYAQWRLGIGAGQSKIHGARGDSDSLTRFSVAYDFQAGIFQLSPTLSLNRVDGESMEVLGVIIGGRF